MSSSPRLPAPADPPLEGLPPGWTARPADAADAPALHALLGRHEAAATGAASSHRSAVDAVLTDGAATHRHVLALDERREVRAWASAQDRAEGRVLVQVLVDPALDDATADAVAAAAFDWADAAARHVAAGRGLTVTQVDSGAFATDDRQQRWLRAAGYAQVRTWLQMTRPTVPADADPAPGASPERVRVRRVRRGDDGMPDGADLLAVHVVLEESFTDHFNYRPERFDELVSRLRADPGHRWDHWWLAESVDAGEPSRPVGALVASVSPGRDGAPDGTYVAYLGVLRSARGRGAARGLLGAAIADAAARGRSYVALEVDADSPTGADALYRSLGFGTSVVTQSWHRDVRVDDLP
ncbi:GNAT family N-acetyltransferase [Cellulomonas shaoxiangyii]|uniref:N-acetyltransferase n=1 Tax=Cellulomonas shaoxiangyii TaxID=2566013 RepID=A0A4P7SIX2_9CELL|nr:GNAT family N-acetyltransferase [Cellulomonas shaoxiangyii]QCB94189.1 N-acetyltransferase [Cellulomonas shaoxiangyii]TGY86682.1 N-acetyltransferase [Cellulomonas shaoxiangyii]